MKGNKSVYYRLQCLLGFLVLPCVLPAQNLPSYSNGEILKKRQEVFGQIGALEDPYGDSLWYHGRIYEFDLKSRVGTPNFLNNETLPGSLTYNGKLHEGLILSYNLVMDELIILETGNRGDMIQIVLNKYFVERFTLKHGGNSYHFRLHTEMNPINDQLKEGFYEVVYEDVLSMFVRHNKVLFFDPNAADHYSYRDENQVYLMLAGKVYVIDSRRDYLNVFQDNKKSLRQYMRQAGINFEESGTQSLSALCAFSKSLLD